MNNNPVLFIDSGIGGIPYCLDFVNKNPDETVYYLADRKNFPYGPRKKEEITSILISLTEKLLEKIEPKIIVLACNTATIAAISTLRQNFPQLPFVGTVPAVKPAAIACNNGKVGVLGTVRTIEDIDSLNLADKTCEIFGLAATELVDFIEQNLDDSDEQAKTEIVKKYVELFRGENVDTLVLGCTHFLFLLEEFRSEAEPYFKVFDSLDGITNRIEYLLDENNSTLRAGKNPLPVRRILLTGADTKDSLWQNRAEKIGFSFSLFDEL